MFVFIRFGNKTLIPFKVRFFYLCLSVVGGVRVAVVGGSKPQLCSAFVFFCVCVCLGVVWVAQHNPSPAAFTANHSGICAAGVYTNRLCAAQASADWLKLAYTGFYLSWLVRGEFLGL